MAKPVEVNQSHLLRALREQLVGPEEGMEFYLKRVQVPSETADTLARLYAAGGSRASVGEFLDKLLKQVLSRKDQAALASIPEAQVAASKAKLFQVQDKRLKVIS